MMSGCASQSRNSLLRSQGREALIEAPVRQARVAPDVPFFPDHTDQCGPSALASVLNFWGVSAEPQALKAEIYVEKVKGAFPTDLVAAARSRGLRALMYQGTLESLKGEVDAGHPVIAFLNLGFAFLPQGHYVVVTGYDDRRQGFYAHSGREKNQFIPYRRFLSHWDKTDRCALLILPAESPAVLNGSH